MIDPFGLPASQLPVLNVPLADAVQAEVAAAGLAGDARLSIDPDVWVNASCLRALAERAGTAGGRLALVAPGWARTAGGPERRELGVAIVPGGATAVSVAAIEIDADETGVDLARGPETLSIAAPRHVAARVTTWADLLWLNLFAMASRVRGLSPAKGAGLVALGALRARSLNPWRIAGKLVARGPGCDIHPSAVVEASVLGRNVKIGPGAVVRGCTIGDGVEIEELALAVGSVIGDHARVQRQGMCKFSLLFPRAAAAGGVQLSILGEGASVRMGAYTIDRRLDGTPVSVSSGSSLVEAGPMLGVAIGPGSSIGTGVWIAAGRAIPAGVTVVRSPEDVLTRVPAGLAPGVYAVAAGTLAKLS